MLKQAIDTIIAVKATTGTNDKIKIIKDNMHNEMLKDIFLFVYDKEFSSGIASDKLKKEVKGKTEIIPNFRNVMKYLKENNTGRDADIFYVQSFLNSVNGIYREVFEEIFMQDLKMGINEKGINKAIPGLLFEFEPMLATKIEDLKEKDLLKLEGEKLYATLKLDGNRVLVYCFEDGKKYAVSRSGKAVKGLDGLLSNLELPYKGYIYDGEMLANVEGTSMEQYDATSTIMRKKGNKKDIKFHIFDLCPIDEFKKGESSAPYHVRREMLDNIKENDFQRIVPVIGVYGINDEELYEKAKEYMDNGEEGIMVNTGSGSYKTNRVKNILKIKKFKECDVLCTGVVEGQGELKGNLGAIEVDFKGKTCPVGSGFKSKWKIDPKTREKIEANIGSAIRREDIWNNPELIIGKIVTIRYMEETKDGVMRMPRIKDIRFDKDEPSYN